MSQIETTLGNENSQILREKMSAKTAYDKCISLSQNLWWSWHPEVISLFRDIDPINWRKLGHNPIALLANYNQETLEERANDVVLHSRINQAYRQLRNYISTVPAWCKNNAGVLGGRPVAYFSLEFGIHESVPIYSGGLGILAGDHIKSASELGVPLVAVGLFYSQGYFKQRLNSEGYQEEDYLNTKIEDLPMEKVVGADGDDLKVAVETRTGTVYAAVWLVRVGRVRLYLLDCALPENKPEDRELTSRLYGGDNRTRIRQEIVCGIGGVKALRAMGIRPGVYHLNEGHNAFATLEVVRSEMEENGLSYDHAVASVARNCIFTTHTPVPAGHDRFSESLVEEHLGPLADQLGISSDQLMGLGRVNPYDKGESFCMTVLGLKLSRRANAVSNLHGHISRRMWSHLYPDRPEKDTPIGHITNGVHVQSWMAWQMMKLFDKYFPSGWMEAHGEPSVWRHTYDIDYGELWETHTALKNLLLGFVRRRVSRQCRHRGDCECDIEAARHVFDPDVLTIGFARRFATYKRAMLIMYDMDKFAKLLSDDERPIQLVFAGKAHPADIPGKKLIQEIANMRKDSTFGHRIAFVEDYDINVGRHLVQGVDVWLNNPRRPLEASGTSGQKAILNGVLNLSVLDGWWAEAYDGSNGFAIGHGRSHMDERITDERDAASLYEILTNEVLPLYYTRDADGIPREWILRMMNSISTCAWRFSADRMVADYTTSAYIPAAGGDSCSMSYK